jgi:hypothetical protein
MDSASDAGTYTCRASNQVGQSANIDFTIGIGSGVTGKFTFLFIKNCFSF